MIRYRHLNRLQLLFRVRGTVIPAVWPPMLTSTMVSIFALFMYWGTGLCLDRTGHVLLTFPIAFLLVFRTNSSYQRYWEGRNYYDNLVRGGTELIRQTVTYVDGNDPQTKEQKDDVIRFTLLMFAAVRGDCRIRSGGDDFGSMVALLKPQEAMALADQESSRPLMLAMWISKSLLILKDKLNFPGALRLMEGNVMNMTKSWRGIQKISFTPLPFPYAHMLYWLMTLWGYTVPFALIKDLGRATVLAAPMLVFAIFGLEAVGSEIEDPFGYDANDLDLQGFENAVVSDADGIIPDKLGINLGNGTITADYLFSGTKKRINTLVI